VSTRTWPGVRAEQALLGAILSEPRRWRHLLAVFEPDDMFRPYHAQVAVAMRRLHDRGEDPGPHEVRAELARDLEMRQQVALDGTLLHTLMAAAPAPAHPDRYAAIVVEGSLRRSITELGTRMTQAARGASMESALEVSAQARERLQIMQARWGALPAQMRQSLRIPAHHAGGYGEIRRRLQGVSAELASLRESLWLATAKTAAEQIAKVACDLADAAVLSASIRERETRLDGPRTVRPDGPDAEAAGAYALRDLAASPSQIKHVSPWLAPGHFASPQLGALYQIMRELAAKGMPCDPVIISWEAMRRGVAMTPGVIAEALDGGVPGSGIASARQAHRHAVLAQIAQAGTGIVAAASDPSSPMPTVFLASEAHLRAVDRERQALLDSCREPDPPGGQVIELRPRAGRSDAEYEAGARQ
jgi:replicative DNA helicase